MAMIGAGRLRPVGGLSLMSPSNSFIKMKNILKLFSKCVILHPDGMLEGAHDPRADGGAAGV